jgi:type IV pilus assembly protein PilA
MRKHEQGFTLIELLTVVSIIAILAAIAIPQFGEYRKKGYNAEGFVLGGDVRKDIQEYYAHTGRFPKDNAEAGLPAPEHLRGKTVESITVRNGAFDIRNNDKATYQIVSVRPALPKGDQTAPLQWVWGNDPAPASYEPVGENRTVENKR